MTNSVDSVVKSFGEFVTGQINITWNTRQTAEQFIEIREQGIVDETDKVEFTAEEFLEYVRANTSDVIQMTLENFGQIGLEKDIFVLSEDGSPIEE